MLKLAAIDIGSNAIRLQLSRVTFYEGQLRFKKLEYVRFPLRLGHDVFSLGKITEASKVKFIKLMTAFKILIDLYEVDDYMACATSAMRDSTNGREIIAAVKEKINLDIEIIDGDTEAFIVNKAIFPHMGYETFLHIDVGGGSTEFNLYVAHEKIASKSFQLGSVRKLPEHENLLMWENISQWLQKQLKPDFGRIHAIGTGGNINKALEMANKKPGKRISLKKIRQVQEYISAYTMEERVNRLQLNPDRADVIVPALDIYTAAMKIVKATSIIVPDSGMKDGMIQILYERNSNVMNLAQ